MFNSAQAAGNGRGSDQYRSLNQKALEGDFSNSRISASASTHPLPPRKISLVGDACRRGGYIRCTATATDLQAMRVGKAVEKKVRQRFRAPRTDPAVRQMPGSRSAQGRRRIR